MTEGNPFERWPGYTEQSWQERFASLDKMLLAERVHSMKIAQQLGEAIAALNTRAPVGEVVAWMYQNGEGQRRIELRRYDMPAAVFAGWTETPLYVHPPATAKEPESGGEGVTQADREALADFYQKLGDEESVFLATKVGIAGIRSGSWDHDWEIQAFRRHRLAHSAGRGEGHE